MSDGQGPLQLRNWLPHYTMEHAQSGINPIMQFQGDRPVAFGPAVLQYRVRLKEGWSEWSDVRFFREGDHHA